MVDGVCNASELPIAPDCAPAKTGRRLSWPTLSWNAPSAKDLLRIRQRMATINDELNELCSPTPSRSNSPRKSPRKMPGKNASTWDNCQVAEEPEFFQQELVVGEAEKIAWAPWDSERSRSHCSKELVVGQAESAAWESERSDLARGLRAELDSLRQELAGALFATPEVMAGNATSNNPKDIKETRDNIAEVTDLEIVRTSVNPSNDVEVNNEVGQTPDAVRESEINLPNSNDEPEPQMTSHSSHSDAVRTRYSGLHDDCIVVTLEGSAYRDFGHPRIIAEDISAIDEALSKVAVDMEVLGKASHSVDIAPAAEGAVPSRETNGHSAPLEGPTLTASMRGRFGLVAYPYRTSIVAASQVSATNYPRVVPPLTLSGSQRNLHPVASVRMQACPISPQVSPLSPRTKIFPPTQSPLRQRIGSGSGVRSSLRPKGISPSQYGAPTVARRVPYSPGPTRSSGPELMGSARTIPASLVAASARPGACSSTARAIGTPRTTSAEQLRQRMLLPGVPNAPSSTIFCPPRPLLSFVGINSGSSESSMPSPSPAFPDVCHI